MFWTCGEACACDRTPHMPKPGIKDIAYRRTTFSKKVKSMKKQAEDLAKQTGAQIKITIFNPN